MIKVCAQWQHLLPESEPGERAFIELGNSFIEYLIFGIQ